MDIAGRAGLFLEGKVSPELQGVEISITERGTAAPLITVATNEMGAYRYENPALHMRDENQRKDVTEPATQAESSRPISLDATFLSC